jgi:dual-specificity kinase
MTNSTAAVGRRPTDWNDFYKNGLPKEIIVIDDDTPPPPSLSSSSTSTSSSASAHHPANGSSQRYHVIQPQMHPAYMPTSQAGAGSIPATTARVTRRTNKRQPSNDLISSGSNGGQSNISNVHYAYNDQYSNGQQRHYAHSGPTYGNHSQSTQQSSHAGPSTNAAAIPPAKKKRRSNAEIKQAQQQQGGQENHPVYYLPAPANLANPPPVHRDVCHPSRTN